MRCLIQFAQVLEEFRLPELLSVSKLHGIELNFISDFGIHRPFAVIEMDEDAARILAGRCILIRSVSELYASGSSYEEVHTENRSNCNIWGKYSEGTSFRFDIQAYNHTIPGPRKRSIIESFSYMDWNGAVDISNPEVVLTCFEEYPTKHRKTWVRHENDGQFTQAYFGRLIAIGSARDLIHTFDVKKRLYYGNTSMDAEVSLLMANQALASPGKLVYDPFVGTGSMLYTAAHFGALVFGSDIDGRQMRGKEHTPGIIRSAEQYNVKARIGGLATFDMTRHPWRCGSIFDAIVTDPPCEQLSAISLGFASQCLRQMESEREQRDSGGEAERRRTTKASPWKIYKYLITTGSRTAALPPTKPYELSELATDLVLYSRYLLKTGGRLVFFLPTVNEDYSDVDIPTSEGMRVVSNSLQDFGNWGRRLITMEKTSDEPVPPPQFAEKESQAIDPNSFQPAHKDFRERYFAGFK